MEEWIKVQDKLPDLEQKDTSFRASEFVHVWGKDQELPEVARLEGEQQLYWYFPLNDDSCFLEEVTHWKPIVKPSN